MHEPFAIASAFNDCIAARDLNALSSLISDDHVFIDMAGARITGKAGVLAAWRSFFAAFPDYRNDFTHHVERGSEVCIAGHSTCSDPRLAGPALWQAVIRAGLLAQWHVLEDTPENRVALGIREKESDA